MPSFLRRAGRTDVELKVQLTSATGSHDAVAKNIGTGGMFVATGNVGRVGDYVRVDFALPRSARMSLDAQVRWIRDTATSAQQERMIGMGLRFVGLPVMASVSIEEFVRRAERDGA